MYTFKAFFILTLVSYVIAAPPSDEPAECKPPKGKEEELSKCCKTDDLTMLGGAAADECFKLIKNKDDKKGPPEVEGYDCLDDCILTKLGLLGADKKIDAAKVTASVKSMYTGDWAEPGAKMVEKCLAQAAANKEKSECSSGADVYVTCTFRESYINCPEKKWTSSDVCKANKERLIKCPNALPYIGKWE